MIRVCLAFLMLLAACGGGGGSSPKEEAPDPRLARLDAFDAQLERVLGDADTGIAGMPVTRDDLLPVTGQVTYEGLVAVRLETLPDDLALLGDASVTVDFTDGSVSGEMDAFFGEGADAEVVDYDGSLDIATLSDSDAPFAAGYNGRLSANGDVVVMDGTLEGVFHGSGAEALSAYDLEPNATFNGDEVNATVVLVAEADGSD